MSCLRNNHSRNWHSSKTDLASSFLEDRKAIDCNNFVIEAAAAAVVVQDKKELEEKEKEKKINLWH